MQHYEPIRHYINRVRARWQALRLLRAVVRSGLVASAVLGTMLAVAGWADRSPAILVVVGAVAVLLVAVGIVYGFAPLRHIPGDAQVARFIEERAPSLDDRLASAVDVATSQRTASSSMTEPVLVDAARRVEKVDLNQIVPAEQVRNAALRAAAVALLLASLAFLSRGLARQTYDAAVLTFFPSRLTLEVTPGNARVQSGTSLVIEARLVGNRAPVVARLEVADGERWRPSPMKKGDGTFFLALPSVTTPFTYRVLAGGVASPTYAVSVAHAPRVTRIDVDYVYPAALGLKPRTEIDSGDIYAPAGTNVRLHVHTDRPTRSGQLALGGGEAVTLAPEEGRGALSASLEIVADNSYRIALVGSDGLGSSSDTEYFIRVLDDRPPEVRIVAPAADRSVTNLDEVEIEAEAEDDYGIDRFELVYAVRGGAEQVVPFRIAPGATSATSATSVTGRHTLYLEDLNVAPGDFVSYYVRARDARRGRQGGEARSDIYFLEIKPFDQEFALAQSQSASGAGNSGSIDDLVIAQKEVVVATWKLDRRTKMAKGARSESDIRAVSRAEGDLKSRVERASSGFRESTMRDPRRRQPGGRSGANRAGQTLPEEDDMAAAASAMGKAVASLDTLKTADALQPEMEALNRLLKAQADVKRRQIAQQQSGNGDNNRNFDLSGLFDQELQRMQQTNYETRSSVETGPKDDLLDKIKELAERQDELLKRQESILRQRETLTAAELKRELEKLTREQSELRQRVEELARQGSPGAGDNGGRMRDASDDMRSAAGDLRRQNPREASANGKRALDKLREVQQRLQASKPDGSGGQGRPAGDMQLEARDLAERQRRIASAARQLGAGESGKEAARRLAAEQERLAERARRLQDGLKAAAGDRKNGNAGDRTATAEAARELERQRVAERMQKSADDMRAAALPRPQDGDATRSGSAASREEIARALEQVAERLSSATGAHSAETQRLSKQLAAAGALRERLDGLSAELARLKGTAGRGERGQPGDGRAGGGSAELARLRDEYARQLQQTRDLLDQLRDLSDRVRRDDPSAVQGSGFTFEGQGMTFGSPGTEAFKQDFARWEQLRVQAIKALEGAESALSKKLQAGEAHDRLAAGVDDKAPSEYQQQVDSYFKALASLASKKR